MTPVVIKHAFREETRSLLLFEVDISEYERGFFLCVRNEMCHKVKCCKLLLLLFVCETLEMLKTNLVACQELTRLSATTTL